MALCFHSRVPAKVMLLGEWGVLHGGPSVLTTVQKDFVGKLSLGDEKQELSIANNDGKRQAVRQASDFCGFFGWAGRCLEAMTKEYPPVKPQLSFELNSDWAVNDGMGSSSATLLTILLLLKSHHGQELAKPEIILNEAISYFRRFSSGSGADIAAQCFGGTIVYQEREVLETQVELPSNLCVIHTGSKFKTDQMIKENLFSADELCEFSRSTQRFLSDGDWDRAFDEHYQHSLDLGLVPGFIQDFRSELEEAKLINAMKCSGAGGGDALLLLVKEGKEEEVKSLTRKRQWHLRSKCFEHDGAALL